MVLVAPLEFVSMTEAFLNYNFPLGGDTGGVPVDRRPVKQPSCIARLVHRTWMDVECRPHGESTDMAIS